MRWLAAAVMVLLAATAVYAQFNEGINPTGQPPVMAPHAFGTGGALPIGPYPTVVTNPGPPPTCSNSLDFTNQCNSQYLVVVVF